MHSGGGPINNDIESEHENEVSTEILTQEGF